MQEIAQFFWVYFMLDGQQALSLGDSITVMHQLSVQLNGLTTVGASGGIYALLLAFGMMFPDEKMFIIPIPIPIKAKYGARLHCHRVFLSPFHAWQQRGPSGPPRRHDLRILPHPLLEKPSRTVLPPRQHAVLLQSQSQVGRSLTASQPH